MEALGYIAYDTLREPAYPFTAEHAPWNADAFAAAVESQDEDGAAALLNGALAQGLHFADLEPALAAAALAHYNDFGHTLIYLMHVRRLIERLGTEVQQIQELERPLLLAWLRSLILATREDLLPDFRHYADALAAWPVSARPGNGNANSNLEANASANPNAQPCAQPSTPAGPDAFEGQSVRRALDATVAAAGNAPLDVYFALMEAGARHLLRFDERHALRTDNSIADNVGWLDFTHALTFGHALRQQCLHLPHLWPQGLLQLAMFVGRNSGYLDAGMAAQKAIREWAVTDEAAFPNLAVRQKAE
ncbi:MAG TPA: hypothetical protein VGG82_05665 [Casimicrobiaceae bacterium]